jgi:hypothetical protein
LGTNNKDAFYEAKDFFIGAVIEVYRHLFVLHDADEFAFNYMESNPDLFPYSNLELILSHWKERTQELSTLFDQLDSTQSGLISANEFRSAILNSSYRPPEQV